MSLKNYGYLFGLMSLCAISAQAAPEHLAPRYRPDPSIDAILAQIKPGGDSFPLEKPAEDIEARLASLGALLRKGAPASELTAQLLARSFQGAALRARHETPTSKGPELQVARADGFPEGALDAAAFEKELAGFVGDYATVDVAEFHVIEINGQPRDAATSATVVADYDIVGRGRTAARVQRRGHWKMSWEKDASGSWRVTRWAAQDETHSQAAHPVFTDVSMAALGGNESYRQQLRVGVDYWRAHLDGALTLDVLGHNGVAVGDYDGDGRDDIFIGQASGLPSRLFRNQGDGTFKDVSAEAGIDMLDAVSMALFADVDNDGDQDLIVITFAQPLLFLNDGKGHFTQKPGAFKFAEAPKGYLTSAVMADYDHDGFLDIFICSYSFFLGEGHYGLPSPYHDAKNGPGNILFHNDGKGGFTDVTESAGIKENNNRFTFAAAWMDYDGDGWPDIALANDFGRKTLYKNQGKGASGKVTFKEVAAAAGIEDYASAGMSAAWLDYNHDGKMDLYFSNMWAASGLRVTHDPVFLPDAPAATRAAFQRHAKGNTLYQNNGDGTFKDVSAETGTEMGRWAWASDALDFDGDGWEDLYVVNGLVTNDDPYGIDSFFWRQTVAESPLDDKPKRRFEAGWKATNRLLRAGGTQAGHERNVFLRNNGAGSFDDVSGTVGLDLDQDGRAFAITDYDGDGDPDLILSSRSAPHLRVLRNDFRGAHAAVSFRLTGTTSNRDAIGAGVTVETDGDRYVKYVQAGSGFLSQHSKELLFGLGASTKIKRVTVKWPSGQEQTFADVAVGQRVWIEEGQAAPTRTEPYAPASSSDGTKPPVDEDPLSVVEALYGGTWLYKPYPAPELALKDLGGQAHTLSQYRGKPVLLTFWTSECMTCAEQLKDLAAKRPAIAAAGAKILTVAADGDVEKARAFAGANAPTLTVLPADDPTLLAYGILDKYLFDKAEEIVLPTTFLIDGKGDISKVYRGRMDAAQMVADLPKVDATALERLARAVPFPGRFYSPPGDRNYVQFGIELSLQGADDAALVAFERAAATSPGPTVFQNLGTLYMKKGQTPRAKAVFERALALQPSFPEVNNSLGALLAQEGNVAGALVQFRTAIEGKPDYADAMNNLGYTYLQSGRPADALRLFQQAVAIQPDFPEVYNNLGIYYGQVEGDLAKSERYFRQAVQKKPRYSEAINNLAMVLAAGGHVADAVKMLQGSIQDDPGFESSYLTLCKIYLGAGRGREGMQVLERLLQKNPKNPVALDLLRQLQGASGPRPGPGSR
jgi:Flp pilus assembly protein TadD/thiol-disulfide isomerase/thioredoxin